ncbi:MAG: Gfo/Idh/MocA family protein [Thermoguttaceae bacterium]
MTNTNEISCSRRTVLGSGTTLAFGLSALSSLASGGVRGANERIRLGFIGIANRGGQLLDAFTKHENVDVAALCDVDSRTLERVHQQFDKKPFITTDFRKIYERNDIDGVVLATPDHWHAIQTVEACQSGKDVYVEKPLSVTVVEGRKMVEAARKYKRVVQVGTHRRSSPLFRELAAKGADQLVGHVTVGRSFRASNMFPSGIGKGIVETPPPGFDWNMWLGPRPERPFQATVAPYKFRWWNLYSSQMGNWGVHYLDAMTWLLGETAPIAVCAMGGRYIVDDDRTIPDTAEAIFEFKKGRILTFGQYEACGNPCIATDDKMKPLGEIELRGTNGTLFADDRQWSIIPERGGQFQDRAPRMENQAGVGIPLGETEKLHALNFLDCMGNRNLPNADIEIGHRSTTMSHIANISLAVDAKLKWDAEKELFTNNDAANALLHYEYRKPWKLDV